MVRALKIAALLAASAAADDWSGWPDPDGNGYTVHVCDGTRGYCPSWTEVLACHGDGHRPQYRTRTPCLNRDGAPAGSGEQCSCADACYADCLASLPGPGAR